VHFVLLAEHNADVCPMSNAKTQKLLLESGPQIPGIAQKHGVNIVAGPYVNREHIVVVVVEADQAEAVDGFLVESRIAQWNSVRILPSLPMEQGMEQVAGSNPLF
jgi:hypothetical protein